MATFTASSANGLCLMHEQLHWAAGARLPIVMAVVNRALSGPLNVWGDHSDAMATRDCGWIQIFCTDGQEAFDQTICAFRIAEDAKVLFPVMVHLDGFHVSHVVEPMFLMEQNEVDAFLPPYKYPFPLHPDKPVTMGAFAGPAIYTEARKAQEEALKASRSTICAVWDEFGKKFGRRYTPVETYRAEDAELLLLIMGSFSQTAEVAVDALRQKGKKVGMVRIRLWRPFPFEEFRQAVSNAGVLAVFDRCLSYGGSGGPLCSGIKAALYDAKVKPAVYGFVGGLGGRDVFPDEFERLIERAFALAAQGKESTYEMIGVRE